MTENPLSYATPQPRQPLRGRERLALVLGIMSCSTGFSETSGGVSEALRLLDYPVGSEVSFALVKKTIELGRIGGLLALPLAVLVLIFGWRRRSTRWLGLVGILLALASIFLEAGLCAWIVSSRKLVPFRD